MAILIAAPLAAAFSILGVFGGRREMFNRTQKRLALAARNATLPAGSIHVAHQARLARDRSGRIMVMLVGTMAEHVGGHLLIVLDQCGLAGAIGSVLLLEGDIRRRQQFLDAVPPSFRSKVVTPDFGSGGFANASPEEVLARITAWGPPVLAGCTEVCDVHQRLNQGNEPALGLTFISGGGSAITGTTAVAEIGRTFPAMKFYGFSALPVDDLLRARTPHILHHYREAGVHGFVLSDNLGDVVRNDFGMVAGIVGLTAAAVYADAAVETNNALRLLFPETPGGIVAYRTWLRPVPAFLLEPRHPSVPDRSFVSQKAVIAAIQAGLSEVNANPRFDSLPGASQDSVVPHTSQFDLVLAAVSPDDLKTIEDTINLGTQLQRLDQRNHHLMFAPIVSPLDASRPRCPITVLSLRAVANPAATLNALTAPAVPALPSGSAAAAPQFASGETADTVTTHHTPVEEER